MLRTLRQTFSAVLTSVCSCLAGNGFLISGKISLTLFLEIRSRTVWERQFAFSHSLVVEGEIARNIDSMFAGHAVGTSGAADGLLIH